MIPKICKEVINNAMHGNALKVEGELLNEISKKYKPEILWILSYKISGWWKPNVFSTSSECLKLSGEGIDVTILDVIKNHAVFMEVLECRCNDIYFSRNIDEGLKKEIREYANENYRPKTSAVY